MGRESAETLKSGTNHVQYLQIAIEEEEEEE